MVNIEQSFGVLGLPKNTPIQDVEIKYNELMNIYKNDGTEPDYNKELLLNYAYNDIKKYFLNNEQKIEVDKGFEVKKQKNVIALNIDDLYDIYLKGETFKEINDSKNNLLRITKDNLNQYKDSFILKEKVNIAVFSFPNTKKDSYLQKGILTTEILEINNNVSLEKIEGDIQIKHNGLYLILINIENQKCIR